MNGRVKRFSVCMDFLFVYRGLSHDKSWKIYIVIILKIIFGSNIRFSVFFPSNKGGSIDTSQNYVEQKRVSCKRKLLALFAHITKHV